MEWFSQVYILQKPRIVYHFKLVHVALYSLYYTCVCSHSLIAWTNFFTVRLNLIVAKKKIGWTENSGQCVKYTIRGLPRVFSCFWISLLLVWDTSLPSSLSLALSLCLSFFHSPPCDSHSRAYNRVYRKRKLGQLCLTKKRKRKKSFLFLWESSAFCKSSQLVYSFAQWLRFSSLFLYICVYLCVCLCFVFHM